MTVVFCGFVESVGGSGDFAEGLTGSGMFRRG